MMQERDSRSMEPAKSVDSGARRRQCASTAAPIQLAHSCSLNTRGLKMKLRLSALPVSALTVGAFAQTSDERAAPPGPNSAIKDKPTESVLQRAASRRFDVRLLPQ